MSRVIIPKRDEIFPFGRWHQRPSHFVFWLYFISHIVFTLLIDLQAILGDKFYPVAVQRLLKLYVRWTGDPLMGAPIAEFQTIWFRSLVGAEVVFQLPIFCFGSYALWKST
jgi:hypothetical protein